MEIKLDGTDWQLTHMLPTEWVWRQAWKETWDPIQMPASSNWIRGTVPGDVIADALDAGLISDPYVDMQSRTAEWVSERDWLYRKEFCVLPENKGKTLRLRFDGVDYKCHIYLNGALLGKHEGMFTPFEYDITERVRFDQPNILFVVVEHAPSVDLVQGQIGWTSQARIWKSRFAYNWDWCTRLVPVGIWQSIRLIITEKVFLDDVQVFTEINAVTANVQLSIQLRQHQPVTSNVNTYIRAHLTDPGGSVIGNILEQQADIPGERENCQLNLPIDSPLLWYPNGIGDQPLYQAHVELLDDAGQITDQRTVCFGIRTIRAVANEGASPDTLPYTIEVNGRKMFVNGWNWAPIDNLYGRPQTERYTRLLTLAQHAHCNLLRVWGGGMLERELFYDLCDQFGILVWQEFHHSSSGIDNRPPDDPTYLDGIETQARQMIPLRRNHPSLAIWCGGNELMDDHNVPLTDAHPALALLKAIVNEMDPGRLWLPTSSSGPVEGADTKLTGTGKMHDVHGPWQYQGPEEQYRFFNNIDALYHSEFGAEGAANLYTLRRFISPQYRWPPDNTNPAWVHHGSWWLHREKLEEMFGRFDDLDSFVRASQWMQAEGLRYAIEANRRRQWRCSGTSPWQLNEAFPNTACTNAVDYLGLAKPAYWWIKRAYEPVHISARYDRVIWKLGDEWNADIWISNSKRSLAGCRWSALLVNLKGSVLCHTEGVVDTPDNHSTQLAHMTYKLPARPVVCLLVLDLLDNSGQVLSRNEYAFTSGNQAFLKMLNAPQTTLQVHYKDGQARIKNDGGTVALFVNICPSEAQWFIPQDSYFTLRPGETRVIAIQGSGDALVEGWNIRPRRIHLP